MKDQDFLRGFDDLVPYQSIERRNDPLVNQRYLISGSKIMDDIEQFRNWWLKHSNKIDYKTIVIVNTSDEVLAYASLQVKKSTKRVSGVISEFLINPNYPSQTQLLHMLLSVGEKLTWFYDCTETIVQAYQIDEDTVRDLDYRRVHSKDCFYFRKKPFEI